MGAYLSEPVTEKYSTDETLSHLSYGASSMQGWRATQEDAHDCIPSFDVNTSLFAVYDGHGGAEIAQYCAMHLPDYIKSIPAYKRGNMAQALEDAFLGFDETLTRPEVIVELKKIAGISDQPNKSGPTESSDDDENEVDHLYAEANMPLDDVLAKYNVAVNLPLDRLMKEEKPQSPFLRAKQTLEAEKLVKEASTTKDKCDSSKKNLETKASGDDIKQDLVNGVTLESEAEKADETEIHCDSGDGLKSGKTHRTKQDKTDSDQTHSVENDTTNQKPDAEERTKDTGSSMTSVQSCVASPSKSEVIPRQDVQPGCSHERSSTSSSVLLSPTTSLGKRASKAREIVVADSEDSSNSEDATYEEGVPCDDDFESAEECEDDNCGNLEKPSDDDEDESSEAEISSEESDDEMDVGEMKTSYMEEPGADSGCTAVVALLNGNELYVANAGDSRCIVCRSGKAIDMSVDHKPEDELELKRITNAGGKVTSDGRVNGGLNLSRAIGDHTYKQNESIPARDQMISALPDIRTLTIDPEEDEFMVLACDGIWNYLSSQEVADFVRERLRRSDSRLSLICEELFDHCLAPHTRGDGTGCDNMTAIIVVFHKELGQMTSAKRTLVETNGAEQNESKKMRSSDDCSSSEK